MQEQPWGKNFWCYCIIWMKQLNHLIYHPSNNYALCILDMTKWSSWSSCTCEKQTRTRKCLQVSQNCHNFTTNESRECNSSFCKGKTSLNKVYLNKTIIFLKHLWFCQYNMQKLFENKYLNILINNLSKFLHSSKTY